MITEPSAGSNPARSFMAQFTSLQIAQAIQRTRNSELGHYGLVDAWVYKALDEYLKPQHKVLVCGECEQGYGPWYSAMVLGYGLEQVYVNDCNPNTYANYPIYFTNTWSVGQYDLILSISSFEHYGLGRYGDPINTDGDLQAMAVVRSMLSVDGKLLLAVPLGKDKVVGDWHRIYGKERLPKLLKHWELVDSFGYLPERLEIDTGGGWIDPSDHSYPGYPEYSPVLVLEPS